jgi:hypothetical protein
MFDHKRIHAGLSAGGDNTQGFFQLIDLRLSRGQVLIRLSPRIENHFFFLRECRGDDFSLVLSSETADIRLFGNESLGVPRDSLRAFSLASFTPTISFAFP